MRNIVSIQSTSDIITNSSTEVFMIYEEKAFNEIKKLVDAILQLGGSDKTFDDLFTINACYSKKDFLLYHSEYSGLDDDKLLAKVMEIDEETRGEGAPFIFGYEVLAKDPTNAKTAELLSNINNIFKSYASYC